MHYHVLEQSIVLNYLGKTVVVSKGDSRFEDVLECIRNGDLDSIPAIVEVEKGFEGTGLELKDGLLYTDGQPIPSELNARILKYKDLGLPYEPLLKFWENLKQNPSYNSRAQLFAFLSHNGHPITEDGFFIAYRGVTNEFKDKHTGKFDNSVGAVCEMPREQVNDNPNETCSSGLHVACFDYAKGFGPQLVEVKVNPKDVVCVPTDYSGTKMRTCRFEVVAVGEKLRTEALYGRPETAEVSEEAKEEPEEEQEFEDYICENCSADKDDFHNFCPECGHEHTEEV
jgi:hypothetical protein